MLNNIYKPENLLYLWIIFFILCFLVLFIQTINSKYEQYTWIVWGWLLINFSPSFIFLGLSEIQNRQINNKFALIFLSSIYLIIVFSFLLLQPLIINYSNLSLIDLFQSSFFPLLIFQGVILFIVRLNLKEKVHTKDNLNNQVFPADIKAIVSSCIRENRIEAALELLFEHYKDTDENKQKDILLLTQRWKENNRRTNLNLVSNEDYNLERTKIINAILNFLP